VDSQQYHLIIGHLPDPLDIRAIPGVRKQQWRFAAHPGNTPFKLSDYRIHERNCLTT
jgi:hypothetical protein